MKPDWKDAPEWANWLAMDANGTYNWFESRPVFQRTWWVNPEPGYKKIAFAGNHDMSQNIEERPKGKTE